MLSDMIEIHRTSDPSSLPYKGRQGIPEPRSSMKYLNRYFNFVGLFNNFMVRLDTGRPFDWLRSTALGFIWHKALGS